MCLKVHILALKRFRQVHVTSACVTLLQLLGEDSALLRLHLQVAAILADASGHGSSSGHGSPSGHGSSEQTKNFAELRNKNIGNSAC